MREGENAMSLVTAVGYMANISLATALARNPHPRGFRGGSVCNEYASIFRMYGSALL